MLAHLGVVAPPVKPYIQTLPIQQAPSQRLREHACVCVCACVRARAHMLASKGHDIHRSDEPGLTANVQCDTPVAQCVQGALQPCRVISCHAMSCHAMSYPAMPGLLYSQRDEQHVHAHELVAQYGLTFGRVCMVWPVT
eukprot:1159820-Pelagomonas_calceolata.AAC.6